MYIDELLINQFQKFNESKLIKYKSAQMVEEYLSLKSLYGDTAFIQLFVDPTYELANLSIKLKIPKEYFKTQYQDLLNCIDSSALYVKISFIHQPNRQNYYGTFETSETFNNLTASNKILKSKLMQLNNETESIIAYINKIDQIMKIYVT